MITLGSFFSKVRGKLFSASIRFKLPGYSLLHGFPLMLSLLKQLSNSSNSSNSPGNPGKLGVQELTVYIQFQEVLYHVVNVLVGLHETDCIRAIKTLLNNTKLTLPPLEHIQQDNPSNPNSPNSPNSPSSPVYTALMLCPWLEGYIYQSEGRCVHTHTHTHTLSLSFSLSLFLSLSLYIYSLDNPSSPDNPDNWHLS